MRSLLGLAIALLVCSGARSAVADAPQPGARERVTTPRATRLVAAKSGAKAPAKPAAPKEATCEVIEFHASNTGSKAVDDRLTRWKVELGKPPLSAFDTFKVTGSREVLLKVGGSDTVKVTASVNVLFKGTVRENDKDRLQLEVTVDTAKGKRLVRQSSTQDAGASQIYSAGLAEGGNLFFVVTCSTTPPAPAAPAGQPPAGTTPSTPGNSKGKDKDPAK